jgi:maleylacetate reductase
VHKGRVVFGAMDEVVFGTAAAEAVVEQMDRLRAARAFMMASRTLNRESDEIDKIRKALGPRCRRIDSPAQVREILLLAA